MSKNSKSVIGYIGFLLLQGLDNLNNPYDIGDIYVETSYIYMRVYKEEKGTSEMKKKKRNRGSRCTKGKTVVRERD